MSEAKRTGYDIEVMARLRFPIPAADPDSLDESDEARAEAAWDARQRYSGELARDYADLVENEYLAAEASDMAPGPPPSLLLTELSRISHQLNDLEAYRNRLLVFARTLSSDTQSARKLAECTGLSHSTIVRMATDEAIAEIVLEAGAVAESVLPDFDPRDDPQLFLRLQGAAKMTQKDQK